MTPKSNLTTEEQAQIATLAAGGWSSNRIAKHIGRSRHTIKHYLDTPEAVTVIRDERQELATLYRQKARDVVVSISSADIAKASLQQKAISSGVLLDKSLLLAGEPTQNLSISVLVQMVAAVREQREAEDKRFQVEYRKAHTLPEVR